MKKSNWVIFFINGLIAIILGLVLLFVPGGTIHLAVRIFGVILLIAGLGMFYTAYQNMKSKKTYVLIMGESIIAIIAGAIVAIYPGRSLELFLNLVGIWAVALGLLQIIVAVQMKKKVRNHTLFTINGVITLVFGLLFFFNPLGTAKALLIIIGVMALVAGVLLVYLGLKVKGILES
jgi:uncharacterized membrane protein HdeD (DUF308 family)